MARAKKQEPKDDLSDEAKASRFWLGEISQATKTFKEYQSRVDKIIGIYRDERTRTKVGVRRMNILWSNVQTLKPALFARTPRPVIERRWLEDNEIERIAGQTLERAVSVEVEQGLFKRSVDKAVLDYLLGGRGVTWLRYEADFNEDKDLASEADEPAQDDDDDNGDEADDQEDSNLPEITDERIAIDYVDRKDFLHDPARTWEEVRWVARRFWLPKSEVKDKFGDEIAEAVSYAEMKDKDGAIKPDQMGRSTVRRAEFWQVWDKPRRKVWVVSPSYEDGICDEYEDPLHLTNFWPCPKPLYATMTNDTLIPVPDYAEYQDQSEEIDDLTRRIGKITEAIKAVGVYDASQPELKRLLSEGTDNMLVPCETWTVLKDRGGLAGSVELFPLEGLIKTLTVLYEARDRSKKTLYEVTGISDIMRGEGEASETATAQRIKGQFGTLRLQERQRDVAEFCRSIIRIMAELIADHYDEKTLAAMTGMAEKGQLEQITEMMLAGQGEQIDPALQEAQDFLKAVALLRDDRLRGFRLDIETDSTIEIDAQTEKQARTEFLASAAQFITSVLPAAEKMPALTPLFGQMLLFGARGFKTGRELESTLEQTVRKLDSDAATKMGLQAQPKPDPKLQVEQSKIDLQKTIHADEMNMEASKHRDQMQLEMFRLAHEGQSDNMDRDHEVNMAQMNGGPPQGGFPGQDEADEGGGGQPMQLTGDPQQDMQIIARMKAQHDAAGNAKLQQLMQAHSQARDMRGSPEAMAQGVRADLQGMMRQQAQAFHMMAQSQNDALMKIAEAMQASSANLVQVAQLLTAPKRVVRNEDGVAVGVETVTN